MCSCMCGLCRLLGYMRVEHGACIVFYTTRVFSPTVSCYSTLRYVDINFQDYGNLTKYKVSKDENTLQFNRFGKCNAYQYC